MQCQQKFFLEILWRIDLWFNHLLMLLLTVFDILGLTHNLNILQNNSRLFKMLLALKNKVLFYFNVWVFLYLVLHIRHTRLICLQKVLQLIFHRTLLFTTFDILDCWLWIYWGLKHFLVLWNLFKLKHLLLLYQLNVSTVYLIHSYTWIHFTLFLDSLTAL